MVLCETFIDAARLKRLLADTTLQHSTLNRVHSLKTSLKIRDVQRLEIILPVFWEEGRGGEGDGGRNSCFANVITLRFNGTFTHRRNVRKVIKARVR